MKYDEKHEDFAKDFTFFDGAKSWAKAGWQARTPEITSLQAEAIELGKHIVCAQIRLIAANQNGDFADDLESLVDGIERHEFKNPQMCYKDVNEAWDKARDLQARLDKAREALEFYADGFGFEQELDNGQKAADVLAATDITKEGV